MAEGRLEQARFERVSDAGELVFSYAGSEFAVVVDDRLERATLEARQIAKEHQSVPPQPAQATLPISQIQSLIRAGADPARVAERYNISTALVRRFSTPVETEKQYAIKQFLLVPAPKDSRAHTLSDLVERTLAIASIDMEAVSWKATRRGLEPWRIEATFPSAGRTVKAEWAWNMHDNSVTSLNSAARKLLGEQNLGASAKGAREDAAPQPALPGDSVRSARIERAVSAWAAPEPSLPAARPEAARPGTTTGSMPPIVVDATQRNDDASGNADSPAAADFNPGSDSPATASVPADGESGQTGQANQEAQPSETKHTAKPAKRRSGRSAVPSWDEILFGD